MRIRYKHLYIIEVNGALLSEVLFEFKMKWGSSMNP